MGHLLSDSNSGDSSTYCVQGTVLSAFYGLSYLNFTTTLKGRDYY